MIKPKSMAKAMLRKLDQFSPYPVFYSFIMSGKEKAIFDEAIKGAHHYLEFGMGGSTIRTIQKSKAMVYSVESSPEWISHMRKYIFLKFFENKRLHIFPVNIGPTGDWGFPVSEDFRGAFEKYSSSIFDSIDSRLIDLALVDGRFRVACTLKIILACHKNSRTKILIHDFWNRPQYHSVLRYLDTVLRDDTIGLFTIKENIDLKLVENDYQVYKFIPE